MQSGILLYYIAKFYKRLGIVFSIGIAWYGTWGVEGKHQSGIESSTASISAIAKCYWLVLQRVTCWYCKVLLVGIAKCYLLVLQSVTTGWVGAGWRYQSQPELSAHFRGLGVVASMLEKLSFSSPPHHHHNYHQHHQPCMTTSLVMIRFMKSRSFGSYLNQEINVCPPKITIFGVESSKSTYFSAGNHETKCGVYNILIKWQILNMWWVQYAHKTRNTEND